MHGFLLPEIPSILGSKMNRVSSLKLESDYLQSLGEEEGEIRGGWGGAKPVSR